MIGRTLGSYRITEQIGMGGMATVYKAYDPSMDRYVAVKVLPEHYSQDPKFRERFKREAKAIARLEHPNILPVFAYGEEGDTAYLAMRYLPSGTLKERIQAGPMPLAEVSGILEQVADALDYAHEHRILHRDVKPSNIMLDGKGNAYLTDFGIAKMVEATVELTGGGLLGTPAYMSPEQCRGSKDLTAASDQYALGVVLYEMVTGRTPYQAETPLALVYMHLNDPLPPPRSLRPDLPDGVEKVLLKALARNPQDRFADCAQMAQALGRAVEGMPFQAPTKTPSITHPDALTFDETIPRPARKKRPSWIVAALAGVAVMVCIIGFVLLGGNLPSGGGQVATQEATLPSLSDIEATTETLPTETPAVTPLPLVYEDPALWPENNHKYEVVRVRDGIAWDAANQDARARGGHLVTITSRAENDFVFSIVSTSENRHGYWLGGYQLPGSSEPGGGWTWVTGEPWEYTFWDGGEPNDGGPDSGGGENYLHFHWENGPRWNDITGDTDDPRGYIVEYE